MERDRPPPPEGFVEALLDRLRAAANQMKIGNEMVQEGQEMQASADADFARIRGAAELYGLDIMDEVKKRFETDVGQAAPDEMQTPVAFERPTIQQFTLAEAANAYPDPVRAADLRFKYERQYNISVHEKSFGMTLYRLSQMGVPLMRREGRADWYYIPPDQRAERTYFPPPGAEDVSEADEAP